MGLGGKVWGKKLRFSYAIVKEVGGKEQINFFFLKNGVIVKLCPGRSKHKSTLEYIPLGKLAHASRLYISTKRLK